MLKDSFDEEKISILDDVIKGVLPDSNSFGDPASLSYSWVGDNVLEIKMYSLKSSGFNPWEKIVHIEEKSGQIHFDVNVGIKGQELYNAIAKFLREC